MYTLGSGGGVGRGVGTGTELQRVHDSSATYPVEFLRQLNSVHRTINFNNIPWPHTTLTSSSLTKNHYFYRSTQSPKPTAQPARHTCYYQASKKKIFSTPPPQSPTQPSTAQREDPPHQQRRDMHTCTHFPTGRRCAVNFNF